MPLYKLEQGLLAVDEGERRQEILLVLLLREAVPPLLLEVLLLQPMRTRGALVPASRARTLDARPPPLPLSRPLPLPQLGLVHVDEEHEEDPGEDGEPREVVARPRTMGCLYVSESESEMKKKSLAIFKYDKVTPR